MLQYIGEYNLGCQRFRYFRCDKCKTDYPVIGGILKCNGHIIDDCPWCKPNSETWKGGRGI